MYCQKWGICEVAIAFFVTQGNTKQLANNKPNTGQQQPPPQQQQSQQQQGPLIGNKPITQSQGAQQLVIGSLGKFKNWVFIRDICGNYHK